MGRHVLIIPDGNRRYARHHGMSNEQVYAFVAKKTTVDLMKYFLIDREFSDFSIFLLSRSNLTRRRNEEVDPIIEAQQRMCYDLMDDPFFEEKNIKFNVYGDMSILPGRYRRALKRLVEKSEHRVGKNCNFLVAYDGTYELISAVKKINGDFEKINESNFYNYLDLNKSVDLLIRTGFEKRLSGAPLPQTSFSELYFASFYYPQFTVEKAEAIIKEFDKRDRRFGK